MRTFKSAMLTLSLLALPMIALPSLAEAGRMSPKYRKTATVYKAKQSNKLRNKVNSKMRTSNARWAKKQANKKARTSIKPSTTRTYISRALHKQANKNYFLNGKRLRVSNVKINNNRISYKGGEKFVGFTAKVKQSGGSSYNAQGFVRQKFDGQPKGQDRVRIISGTPTFGVIVR